MMRWIKWSVPAALTAATLSALALQACNSQFQRAALTRSSPTGRTTNLGLESLAPEASLPPSAPSSQGWSPVGLPQDTTGHGGSFELGLNGRERGQVAANDSLDYHDVPRIDLRDALQSVQSSSGGGGASARSPFATPALGDIPVLGDAFGQDGAKTASARAGWTPHLLATEELWVISRACPPSDLPHDDAPGCGSLMTQQPDASGRQIPVAVPLKHTDVHASILGWIATVDVQQQFQNPYSSKIEALYVFPLPENAAVNEFVMTIGDRHIRGLIREREEAKQIYAAAKAQGYAASLLTQERPNIFTQAVANIDPGKEIDIDIKYFHTLSYNDGGFDFVFPMVVGPRFNPPSAMSGVGAVARGAAGASGQQTEVQYLRPIERSGQDVGVTVDIDAGVSIERIVSPSHEIEIKRESDDSGKACVRLARTDTIPNRDFVLRYEVAGDQVKSALLTQADPTHPSKGGYFALMVIPPAELKRLKRSPMEIVFVVDRSGSMSGQPIAQARAAVEHGLRRLQPCDTFQIIDFAESASQLGEAPLPATRENVERGLRYAAGLDATGGTYMINGLRAALAFPHDPTRLRVVSFLTDGYIGNEEETLRILHQQLGATRVFGFGVSASPNRYLLADMSRLGRGAVAYVGMTEPAGEVMNLFFDRVSHPAMADLDIDWGGARVSDVFPSHSPDLYVGRPVVLTGRYEGDWSGTIRVRGRTGGQPTELNIPADNNGARIVGGALPAVWARMKIAELADREMLDGLADAQNEIKRVALDYSLMSSYTAFVAVDSLTRTEGEYGTTVPVPVRVPEGVRYQTTVGGTASVPR